MWKGNIFSFPSGRIYPLILVVKADTFPGLLGLINDYVDTLQVNEKDRKQIDRYLDLVKRRANGSLIFSSPFRFDFWLMAKGSLQTPATWIRNFVRTHPEYKFDSVVSQEINYDLMMAVDDM